MTATGDDEIEAGPGGHETARLAGEPADDPGAPAAFFQGPLQQVATAASQPTRLRQTSR
jgi:hypothetical protein